jgi:hypothetical protein
MGDIIIRILPFTKVLYEVPEFAVSLNKRKRQAGTMAEFTIRKAFSLLIVKTSPISSRFN